MPMPESEEWPEGRPEPPRRHEKEKDTRTGRSAAAERIRNQTQWVDLQVRRAMERGEFDDLPGKGRPIADLGVEHDPDWWLRKLVEREKISVLPPALALRKEDLGLEGVLDREATEKGVRSVLEDFNRRVAEARRQLEGGPPVVTPTRDVEAEVAAWHARRTARRRAANRAAQASARPSRRWWRRS